MTAPENQGLSEGEAIMKDSSHPDHEAWARGDEAIQKKVEDAYRLKYGTQEVGHEGTMESKVEESGQSVPSAEQQKANEDLKLHWGDSYETNYSDGVEGLNRIINENYGGDRNRFATDVLVNLPEKFLNDPRLADMLAEYGRKH